MITSYEDFAERFLTTVSTTRNIKRYVVKHLAPLGIGIDDEYRFTGDESAIRVFFYRPRYVFSVIVSFRIVGL